MILLRRCREWIVGYHFNNMYLIANLPIIWFKIVNGQYQFVASNPNVKIIWNRERDPPTLKVENTGNPNEIKATGTDANLKGIYYIVNGGPETQLTNGTPTNMGLSAGTYTIKVIAKDYFRLEKDTTFTRTITTQTNNAPVLTRTSPTEGQTFTTNNITLQYNITDKENDAITTSYRFDNTAEVATGNSVNKQVTLPNGLHKLIIKYADATHAKKDSTNFTINVQNNAPIVTIISPIDQQKYTTDMINLEYTITDPENDPLTASFKINNEAKVTTEPIYSKQLKLVNGTYKTVVAGSDATHVTKDSVTFIADKPTGIDPTLEDKITAYPIPAGDYLNIKRTSSTPKIVYREIYNITGRLLDYDKVKINQGETVERIDLRKLPSGKYIIKESPAAGYNNFRTFIVIKE